MKFLDWHQANNHRLSVLLSKTCVQGNAPGPKVKRKTERDLIALESSGSINRLAFMAGETDFEDDFLAIHKNLLLKLNFTTKLNDCYVYVIDRILIDLINVIPNEFVSLKTDLLPFVIRLQHFKWSSIPPLIQALLKKLPELRNEDCFEIKCAAYVMNNDEFSICARLNSIGAYFETNKQVLKSVSKLFPDPMFAPLIQSQSNTKAQIGADSLVGQGTLCAVAGKKTQIKRSIIGRQCTIGENCKLNNCVIMDHVRIADGW
uniref:Translation initiation factor eIF-2B subunit gamma n=1 Tax=Romanomermis culicivorax TaxID=13658 RepID=A0A915JJU8_ROMCU